MNADPAEPAVAAPHRRSVWSIGLRVAAVAISAALLWWIVAEARWQGVVARLARLDGASLAAMAVLFAASYAMRGARIHGEFRDEIASSGAMRTPGNTYLRILRLTLVHNALVNVVPFRGGEVAFPVLLSRWFGIGTGRAIVSLLWLRAQDATVVLALAALVWPGLAVAWRVAALAAIVIGAWAVPAWARRHGGFGHGIEPRSRAGRIRALLERSTRRNTAGWLWTIGNWTVKLVAEAWLVTLALAAAAPEGVERRVESALHAGIDAGVLGALGAELAAILPIQGVAGFGTFEAGGAALLRTVSVPLSTGLEAVLVLHAVVLALAVAAGCIAAIALPGSTARVTPVR